MKIPEWIRESNLIEGVDASIEDRRSYMAWIWFKKQPLTLKTILKLHQKIMWVHLDSRRDQRGKWRTVNVRVGGRICSDWSEVKYLMIEWIVRHDLINMKEIEIQWAHIAFQKIHPFIDGNGRTGRMIMNWQRVHFGLKPLCIKASERQDYYEWFK